MISWISVSNVIILSFVKKKKSRKGVGAGGVHPLADMHVCDWQELAALLRLTLSLSSKANWRSGVYQGGASPFLIDYIVHRGALGFVGGGGGIFCNWLGVSAHH